MNERPIPNSALRDPNAVELIRVWIAEKGLHCSMKIGMYESMQKDEPAAWGIIIADIAKHVSNATCDRYNVDYEEILDRIRSSFIDEVSNSTSIAKGNFRGH